MTKLTFASGKSVEFQPGSVQDNGRILVHSGMPTRNRDWWTGKIIQLGVEGIRTDSFNKNPLVPFVHNPLLILGRGEVYTDGGMLWADGIDFHRLPIPTVGGVFETSLIADLWDKRVLNAVSVHVILSPDDEQRIVETDDTLFIPTSEMLEFSVVTFPADREALRNALPVDEFSFSLMCPTGGCEDAPTRGIYQLNKAVYRPSVSLEADMSDATPVQEVEVPEAILETIEIDPIDLAQAISESPEAMALLLEALLAHPLHADSQVIETRLDNIESRLSDVEHAPTRVRLVARPTSQPQAEDSGEDEAPTSAPAPRRQSRNSQVMRIVTGGSK